MSTTIDQGIQITKVVTLFSKNAVEVCDENEDHLGIHCDDLAINIESSGDQVFLSDFIKQTKIELLNLRTENRSLHDKIEAMSKQKSQELLNASQYLHDQIVSTTPHSIKESQNLWENIAELQTMTSKYTLDHGDLMEDKITVVKEALVTEKLMVRKQMADNCDELRLQMSSLRSLFEHQNRQVESLFDMIQKSIIFADDDFVTIE